jgi:hypothetical protein
MPGRRWTAVILDERNVNAKWPCLERCGDRVEEIVRHLASINSYASELQQLMADLHQASPASSRGVDRTGTVQAVLGRDGLPEAIRVQANWKATLDPRSFAAAVTEASEAAARERGLAWSRELERSGWQQRAARLGADSVGVPPMPSGAVPSAFMRAGGARPRSAERLAEETIDLAETAVKATRAARQSPRGVGRNRGGTLTLTLSRGGQVSCQADPRWVAEQSGHQLSEALSAALAAARRELAASRASSASDHDFVCRQQRLLGEIFATLENPQRSF